MKINQIIKKYRKLHAAHLKSWDDAQKRIRLNPTHYGYEALTYHQNGSKILDDFIKELDGHEIFPKK